MGAKLPVGQNVTPVFPAHLWGRNFDIDNDGSQRGFGQLGWVVDGVCIQHYQLQGLGQFKDPLNLALDFSCKSKRRTVNWTSFSPRGNAIFSASFPLYVSDIANP